MVVINLPWLFIACVIFSYEIHASSHWLVTDSGLIKPLLDSPFDMARPYDLIELLNQEKRWDFFWEIYHDLRIRQIDIDELWDDIEKFTKIGRRISKNNNCLKAGNINTIDWYTSLLEDGSNKIHPNEYLLPNPYYGSNTDTPDCNRISTLAFSMFAYEHLVSMKEREKLSAESEHVLPEMVTAIMSVDQYGHWLTEVLRRNSSSWLHYHLASLFWRIRGSIPKAVECSRRALHFAPRVFKDVALLGLGMAFHRTGKTEDAVIIFKAAVDHDPKNYVSHFSAANAYSIAGDFNNSLKFYDKTLTLNPRIEIATKHKYGVQCHAKLAVRIKKIREIINKLRVEVNEYNLKQAPWPKMQSELLKNLKNGEDDYDNIEKTCEKMNSLTGLDVEKLMLQIERNSLIKYFLDGPLYEDEKFRMQTTGALDILFNLERLIWHVNRNEKPVDNLNKGHQYVSITELVKEAWSRTNKKLWNKHFPDVKYPSHLTNQKNVNKPSDTMSEYETGIFMYPPMMTVNRNVEDFDKEVEWPSDEFCKAIPKVHENLGAIIPVFLPFENKGIRLKSILTEKIGVPLSEEYELPWHPPTCTQERDVLKKYKHGNHEVLDTGHLRTKLLEYVGDGKIDAALHMQDAEIGQRIYAAMKKKVAPKWMLLTLSSLYWRVRKNNANALQCLHTALRWVQEEYKDLVLASISSIYLEMGYTDQALSAADAAFRISLYEPTTNFLLAQISTMRKNHNTLMFHLKQTVRVEPRYLAGRARSLLDSWSCLLKQLSAIKEMDMGEGDICTHVKPMMNLACDRDGDGCHMSNIKCYSSQERAETSRLVMLLKEKDTYKMEDVVEVSFFDRFIANKPTEQSDISAHNANYDNMVETINSDLNGCGTERCKSLKPEDLSMKEEECSHHHSLFGYWIHIVSFRQLFTDSNAELPSEIALLTPTSKKVPECRIVGDRLEDFVTEKLGRVRSEGWEPVLSLMHLFKEIFNSFDYVSLGAKIARYVDTRPTSWRGLLGAGWWCGAGGRGACALRCLSAAHALAPPRHRHYALRALVALLHIQSKQQEAKEVAILSFYSSPKSKIEAFLVAVSHAYLGEYDQAIWMYRYALALDGNFVPAKACLHATMCLMFFGDKKRKSKKV